jgi:F-type H+-transporting ATPase subunit b
MKFSITTFIIQIINFVLLSYILYRVLYRPLRNIMEKRKRLVMEDIDRAVRMKEDAIGIKEKYEKLMKEMAALKNRELEKAVEQAEEAKQAILERAAREAREEKEKAAAVIENERTEMMAALKTGIAEVSAELASRLLEPLADEALHRKLTEMMLRELEEHPPAVPEKSGEGVKAVVLSAYALSGPEHSSIESMLKDYMGPTVSIEHKVDPELIAGVRLWLDGNVFDGSLKGHLGAFKERAIAGLE